MTGSSYFSALSEALERAGRHQPTLVVDVSRLDENIDKIRASLPAGRDLRLVDKSLACIPLLDRVSRRIGISRFMSFHLPIAKAVLEAFPNADILFGKPMPAPGVKYFLASLSPELRLRVSKQVTFLIDTVERLEAYAARLSSIPIVTFML